jgi:sporulation protein YlmC with PRC-barrel domain
MEFSANAGGWHSSSVFGGPADASEPAIPFAGDAKMTADEIRVVPKNDDATVAPGLLRHLSEMNGFMIADPAPDIRGWKVELSDGRKVGSVSDLVVDTTDRRVRYLEVKADHHVLGTDDDEWMLIPVRPARIDEKAQAVVVDRLPATALAGAPRFTRGALTKAQEQQLQDYYGADVIGDIIEDQTVSRDQARL